jgi:hypothetical protein
MKESTWRAIKERLVAERDAAALARLRAAPGRPPRRVPLESRIAAWIVFISVVVLMVLR